MNERLREPFYTLMWKASTGYNDSWSQVDPEVLEKFAEMIVSECIRYFNEDYQRDFDTLWREDLSEGIKQHFGVEE